jgi:hypothetical protein
MVTGMMWDMPNRDFALGKIPIMVTKKKKLLGKKNFFSGGWDSKFSSIQSQ